MVPGLAIFVTAGGTEVLRVDAPMPERAVLGDRLYLRPLFAACHRDVQFWALALDKSDVRLVRGDRASFEDPAAHRHARELRGRDEVRRARRCRSSWHERGIKPYARGIAQFHGHGGEKDTDKVSLLQFLLEVDRGVTSVIGAQSTDPLVVLGVGYIVDAYRGVASYAGIVPERINGATGHLSATEIHDWARTALAARIATTIEGDLAELAEKAGTGSTSADPAEVLAAAAAGRVKTLFMDSGAGPWGTIDRATFVASAVCDAQPTYVRDPATPEGVDEALCGWDLVDLAAVETITHGGTVHTFTGEDPRYRESRPSSATEVTWRTIVVAFLLRGEHGLPISESSPDFDLDWPAPERATPGAALHMGGARRPRADMLVGDIPPSSRPTAPAPQAGSAAGSGGRKHSIALEDS